MRRGLAGVALVVGAFVVAIGMTPDAYTPVSGATLTAAGAAAPPSCIDPSAGAGAAGLSGAQAGIARVIVAAAQRRGLGTEGAVIGVAAGLVESELRNLDYGDRDSLGVFQQRPSQGWGSPGQVQTPVYAADRFMAALAQVPGWRSMAPGDAAQNVQRSAFPTRYATRMGQARSIVTAVSGQGGGAPGCAPDRAADIAVGSCPASGSPAERGLRPTALRGLRCTAQAWPRLEQFGGVGGRPIASDHPFGLAVDYMVPRWSSDAGRAYGWQVARWVAANADRLDVTYIIWDAQIWRARTGRWSRYSYPSGPTTNPTLLHLDHVHVSYAR